MWLQALDSDTVAKMAPRSLRYCYVVPGDILYLPFGTIFVERACKTHSVNVRSHSTLMCKEDLTAAAVFATAYCKFLALF